VNELFLTSAKESKHPFAFRSRGVSLPQAWVWKLADRPTCDA